MENFHKRIGSWFKVNCDGIKRYDAARRHIITAKYSSFAHTLALLASFDHTQTEILAVNSHESTHHERTKARTGKKWWMTSGKSTRSTS